MKTQIQILLLLISNLIYGQKFIAQYEFNGNAKDRKGLLNAISYGASLTKDRYGNKDNAYQFDGVDDYLEINSGLLNVKENGSFSIETFALIQKNSGEWADFFGVKYPYLGGSIFSFYGCAGSINSDDPDVFKIEYTNEGKLIVTQRTKDVITELAEYNVGNALFNQYHHIVIVRDGRKAKLKLFLDGDLLSEIDLQSTQELKSFPAYIGKHKPCPYNQFTAPNQTDGLFLKGKLDYFRIYNSALNNKQVKKQYQKERVRDYCGSNEDKYFDELNENLSDWEYENYLSQIKIYPNPNNGNFSISVPDALNFKNVVVSSTYGNVIYSSGITSNINLSCVPAGVYFVSLQTDRKTHTYKIIVQR